MAASKTTMMKTSIPIMSMRELATKASTTQKTTISKTRTQKESNPLTTHKQYPSPLTTMNTSNTPVNAETVEQTSNKPPLEADEIPTVILDASFFRRRSRTYDSDVQEMKTPRTCTLS